MRNVWQSTSCFCNGFRFRLVTLSQKDLTVSQIHLIPLPLPLPLPEGAFADGEPHGQTRGGADCGERSGGGGAGVHEGHGRH